MSEIERIRIDREDNPHRCQTVTEGGQCNYLAMENSTHCRKHAGGQPLTLRKKIQNQYNLAQWQARVEDFATHDNVKSLRDEIGMTRMLLEKVFEQCKDTMTLMIYSTKITDLVTKIKELVVACHRLEASTGSLLDKSAALHLASQMVEIISRYVPDPKAIDEISAEIAQMIVNMDGSS